MRSDIKLHTELFYNEMKQLQCFLVKVHREIVLEVLLGTLSRHVH